MFIEEDVSMDSELEEEFEDAILESILEDNEQSMTKTPPLALPIFPLPKRVFFPGMAAPIFIEPGPFYEILKQIAATEHKCVGLLLTKQEELDLYKLQFKDLYSVGVMARILRIIPTEQGGAQVVLSFEKRFIISKIISQKKALKAKVTYIEDKPILTKELKAYSISIISAIRELVKFNPLFKEELELFLRQSDFTEPSRLADFAVALTSASREELQEVLETFDVQERIDKVLLFLKKELDLSMLQNTINQKIESSISKTQKDFFLKEQLKTIKKELGLEKEEKSLDKNKFELRIKDLNVPEHVQTVISEELERFSSLEVSSPEYSVSRGYLDWLTSIPWGVFSKDRHNLKEAQKILDEDHYGLEDIKKRILEFMAVGKLTQGVKGTILCLVGPPGVGKTSIGKSIARALGRKFYRFSVGGMRDEAEIKGHRRTYIGAMPGKLIQALKMSKSMNPVILLDEVDKMGQSYQGDPASALLEVLDPEQNIDFLDHYLDVRCDLSQVLFILTANTLDSIPEPLKDRMEILRLSGYILEEKLEIAKKYLIPKNRVEMGVTAKHLQFTDAAIKEIVHGYARESGVRSLENYIKKILRKAAFDIVKSGSKNPLKKISVSENNINKFLGNPVFTTDRFYEQTPIGVATGLAWTSMGGATLYIETVKVPSDKTFMKLTGQAGDVMRESSEIAWTFLHESLGKYLPNYAFFENHSVHVHIPEGATPKDGPSAGITMVCALLSLLSGTPILEDLGMTGELTLTGRVLPIGGVKEKIVAAKRSQLHTLIFPKQNLRDVEELPSYLKEGIKFHFVDHFDEVKEIAFPHLKGAV